jgi:hypothetical protein
VPQNGEVNTKFGVYKSDCCGVEIVISQGATFPDCPNHPRRITIWQHFLNHIEYRRLRDLAGGRIKAEEWEQDHLHECRVCEGILVYLNQTTQPSESEDDAA